MPLLVEGRQRCNPIHRICGIGCYGHWSGENVPRRLRGGWKISRVWVYQVRGREQKTGQRTSFQIGGHRRSRVAAMESVLRAWIEQAPGLSLAELCERLAEQGIAIKIGALWHQLNKWNLTFKKNPARQRARTRGRAAGAKSVVASAAHVGSRKARVYR